MRSYPHFAEKLFASPLMLHPPARAGFETYLLQRMGAGSIAEPPPPRRSQADERSRRIQRVYEKRGRLGIVRIFGAIDKSLSELEMECFGGCDLADVDRALAQAAADRTVDTVLLEINSPGGSVTGTPETAIRIAELRKTKEVHAYTETMAASAAYWLASQADHITATPSSTVGSIGVYIALTDESRALEMQGITVNLIKAGALKATGSWFKALEPEEREFLQAGVDRTWADFKKACTSLRRIDEATMQGQWFDGTEAKARGLVDQLTNMNADEYADLLAA